MAIVSIRTFSDPFYTMTVPLDGTDYAFEFRFNHRENCWYFDISLSDGTLLVAGVKVICHRPLLARFANVHLPKGILIAASNSEDTSPPGLEELGEGLRVELIYQTAS